MNSDKRILKPSLEFYYPTQENENDQEALGAQGRVIWLTEGERALSSTKKLAPISLISIRFLATWDSWFSEVFFLEGILSILSWINLVDCL
jgi:hypothetical protein